jgi:hypothetical protein
MPRLLWMALIATLAVPAASARASDDGRRYAFEKVERGTLRLDRATGEVSLCSRRGRRWACRPVEDPRASAEARTAEARIARLQTEVAALQRQIAEARRTIAEREAQIASLTAPKPEPAKPELAKPEVVQPAAPAPHAVAPAPDARPAPSPPPPAVAEAPPRPPADIPPPRVPEARDPSAAPPAPPASPAPPAPGPAIRMPTDAEINRSVAFVERLWSRLVEMMARVQRDLRRDDPRNDAPTRT